LVPSLAFPIQNRDASGNLLGHVTSALRTFGAFSKATRDEKIVGMQLPHRLLSGTITRLFRRSVVMTPSAPKTTGKGRA